jgi:hypothetical protein
LAPLACYGEVTGPTRATKPEQNFAEQMQQFFSFNKRSKHQRPNPKFQPDGVVLVLTCHLSFLFCYQLQPLAIRIWRSIIVQDIELSTRRRSVFINRATPTLFFGVT